MNTTAKRFDVNIYNEATAFSITSASAVKKMITEDLWEEMQRVFDDGLAIAVELYQDDGFNARIVLNDELKDEENEWMARVTGRLNIPCGKAMVCGGFDPDVFHEFDESGESEFIAVVDIPPGAYRVDIYTYLNSINGKLCLSEDIPVGEWFRASYPGKPFPLWLAAWCEFEPDRDPGYEAAWEDSKASVANGRLSVALDKSAYIEFLIQFRPATDEMMLSSFDNEAEGGFFMPNAGLQTPERCPVGVRSSTLPLAEYNVEFLEADGDDSKETPQPK